MTHDAAVRPHVRYPHARSTTAAIVVLSLASLTGCETKVPSSGPPANSAQNPPKAESSTVIPGGGSALGKAKNSAESLKDKAAEHDQQIEKAIDDVTNPR